MTSLEYCTLYCLCHPLPFIGEEEKVEPKKIILFDSVLGLGFQFTFHEYFGIMNREEMDERKSTLQGKANRSKI